MLTQFRLLFPLFAGAAAILWPFFISTDARAQGSLTPPGAPAPTMKTLAQIEPRIAVHSLAGDANAQFLISQPGSYYLTGGITGTAGLSAIAINSDNVSIDLGGHSIIGVATANYGIEIRGTRTQITIENGSVRTFGQGGVASFLAVTNVRVERVNVAQISAGGGIVFVAGSTNLLVRGCTVNDVATVGGIFLPLTRTTVEHCVVSNCASASGPTGIAADTVTGCSVANVTSSGASAATGILGSSVQACTVGNVSNSSTGLATAINASAVGNSAVDGVTTGAGAAAGISSRSVDHCTVINVNGGTGAASRGIFGNAVSNCRVASIGVLAASTGSATGIDAATVQASSVTNVGSTTSTGTATGIISSTVTGCTINTVGNVSSSGSALGISGTAVTSCTVASIAGGTGASGAVGISTTNASQCSVNLVSLAGGIGSSTGISAELITDCRVGGLSSSSSGNTVGLLGYRIARSSSITGLSSAGSGSSLGCSTLSSGRTESVSVSGSMDVGISVGSGQMVIGCNVGAALTGILATGTRSVIDGNNLLGTSTTGISVTSGTNQASALVIRNQMRLCTTNILADAPAQLGPIVIATGTLAAGTHPFSNFADN